MLKAYDNKSPLRYPGGKTRACKVLNNIFKEHFDVSNIKTIVSPFFGGGSFEFYMQNEYNMNIIANDKFTPLYNFWNTCKTDKAMLCDDLYKRIDTGVSKEMFLEYRSKIMMESGITQAYMYFIINRCSFSGSTLSGGFSLESSQKRFTKSSIDRINELDLGGFEIYNKDYEEFMGDHLKGFNVKKEHFLFLDPPYYLEKKSKLYGNKGDLHEEFDHDRLYDCVSKYKNWMMTYNNCEYIKELYKEYTIIDANWAYGMNKSKESSEIVIIG